MTDQKGHGRFAPYWMFLGSKCLGLFLVCLLADADEILLTRGCLPWSPLASVSHRTSRHSFSNLFPIYPVLSIHPLWPGSKRRFLRTFSILVKALWGALSQLCMQDSALTLWALGPSFISDHTVLFIHLFSVSVSSGDRTHPSVVHLVSLFSVMQDYSLIARLPYRKGQHNPPPGCGCGLMLHQHCEHSIVLVWPHAVPGLHCCSLCLWDLGAGDSASLLLVTLRLTYWTSIFGYL